MAEESACAGQMAPGEEHKKLEDFVGTFKAAVTMWMGPGEPFQSTGKMVNTMDLDGRYLRQDYQGHDSGGPFPNFQGRGFWGYNTLDNCYEGFWIDTASTMMQTEKGQVDAGGKVWTMEGEMTNPQGGGTLKKRSVITLEDRDHHVMEMYFVMPDGNEHKGMEIRYERES